MPTNKQPAQSAIHTPTRRQLVGAGNSTARAAPPRVAVETKEAPPRVAMAPRRLAAENAPAMITRARKAQAGANGPAQNTIGQASGQQLMSAIETFNKKKCTEGICPMKALCEMANAVVDVETEKMLEYRHLRQDPKYKDDWDKSAANKFGCLAQGVGDRIKLTNIIVFVITGFIE